jgi:hypothetical protein
MWAGVGSGILVYPVPFRLYRNDIHTSSHHVKLAKYAEDTAVIATSRDPSLLVGYLEAYLGRLDLWLRNWWIAMNVPKSTAVLFAKASRRVRQPRPVHFLRRANGVGVISPLPKVYP